MVSLTLTPLAPWHAPQTVATLALPASMSAAITLDDIRTSTMGTMVFMGTPSGRKLYLTPSYSVSAERLLDIGDQVADVLDADREPHQVRGAQRSGPLDARAMLGEAFDRTQRRRALEDAQPCCEVLRRLLARAKPHGHHPAVAAAHLARRHRVARMQGETGIEHVRKSRMQLEVLRDGHRILAGARDAQVQRAHAAQKQPRLERSQHRAARAAHIADLLPALVVGSGGEDACDHIGVP